MDRKATIAVSALAAMLLLTLSTVASAAKVKTRTSDFDGATEVSVEPHGANCGFTMLGIAVGATWSSLWGEDAMLHAETINHHMSMDGAALSIDGRVVKLKQQALTNHGHTGSGAYIVRRSTAPFMTTLQVLRDVVAARTAMIRISTADGYEECYIVKDGSPKGTKALDAMKRFLTQVDAVKPGLAL